MGCIGSRLAVLRNATISDRRRSVKRQNTFAVLNVDDIGRHVSPGKLEVTETDLVLHVRGKASLTWPLRCLRRYGYDNDLFSFESGRRCPTGAGIFAFRCHRAQSLFNLLQSKIQGNPGATPNTVPTTPITPTSSSNNNPSTPVSSTFVYVNLAENSSNRQTTNAPPDVTQVHLSGSQPTGLSSQQSHKLLENNCHPLYMNVESPTASAPSVPVTRAASVPYSSSGGKGPLYVNHHRDNGTSTNDSVLYTNVVCATNREKAMAAQFGCSNEPAEVNYAELDLKTDNCSSTNVPSSSSGKTKFSLIKENGKLGGVSDPKYKFKFGQTKATSSGASSKSSTCPKASTLSKFETPASSNGGELGYATIDFDRTAALSVVTRSKINLNSYASNPDDHHVEGSVRKTRHNSTAL